MVVMGGSRVMTGKIGAKSFPARPATAPGLFHANHPTPKSGARRVP